MKPDRYDLERMDRKSRTTKEPQTFLSGREQRRARRKSERKC